MNKLDRDKNVCIDKKIYLQKIPSDPERERERERDDYGVGWSDLFS